MLEDSSPYWKRIQHLCESINIYDGQKTFLSSCEGVPRPLLLVFAANFCMDEVHNGGFLQFFMNSTGILTPEAIEGLHAIEMPLLAAVVSQAALPLGFPYPRDRDARQRSLLAASKFPSEQVDDLMADTTKDHWRRFLEATVPLGFESLDTQVYALAGSESGGFDVAAEGYFRHILT